MVPLSLKSIVPTIAAIAVIALAMQLGQWQSRRALEKLQLKASLAQAEALGPLEATQITPADFEKRKVQIQGAWLSEKTIFLDNRTHNSVAGFHVITPFKIEQSDNTILVLRGWVARSVQDRQTIPIIREPLGTVVVGAIAQADLIKSYELGKAFLPQKNERIWQSVTRESFQAWSGLALMPFVLRQTTANPADGLIRQWPSLNVDETKHQGYALQWYSLAALTLLLWLWFVPIRILKIKYAHE